MIIVGWGHRTVKNYGAVRKIECSNCFNERMWQLQKVRYWITFFFIPIIPYRTEHILVCPICGRFDGLMKGDFEQLQAKSNVRKTEDVHPEKRQTKQ